MPTRRPLTVPAAEKPSLRGEVINTKGAARDDILKLTRKFGVDFLRLQFTDITGINKNVEVPENGRASVEFLSLDVPFGRNKGDVKLSSGDILPSDDTYYF